MVLESQQTNQTIPGLLCSEGCKMQPCVLLCRAHPGLVLTLTPALNPGGHCPGLCEVHPAPSGVHVVY